VTAAGADPARIEAAVDADEFSKAEQAIIASCSEVWNG
jgi:hypothetical protein